MVNKQVIGRERVGKAWGREETPVPGGPGAGRALYRREDEPVEGDTVSGGSLEPHCLRKVFTCIHHTGARHTQAPRGHLGEAGPSAPQMVTPGPSLGLSVDLYTVWASIYRHQVWGCTSQEKVRTAQAATPALKAELALLSVVRAPARGPDG